VYDGPYAREKRRRTACRCGAVMEVIRIEEKQRVVISGDESPQPVSLTMVYTDKPYQLSLKLPLPLRNIDFHNRDPE
jgi:hypothetical protein